MARNEDSNGLREPAVPSLAATQVAWHPTDFPPGASVRTIGPGDEWTMDENGGWTPGVGKLESWKVGQLQLELELKVGGGQLNSQLPPGGGGGFNYPTPTPAQLLANSFPTQS